MRTPQGTPHRPVRLLGRVIGLFGLLALSSLVAPEAVAGRHQIIGRVIDRNGEPVARAIVSLDAANVELVTDRDGRFVIDYARDRYGERTRLAKKTDYKLEIFKPGFHTHTEAFYYKRGTHEFATFTLSSETIRIEDDRMDLDPELHQTQTQSTGATYEGQ